MIGSVSGRSQASAGVKGVFLIRPDDLNRLVNGWVAGHQARQRSSIPATYRTLPWEATFRAAQRHARLADQHQPLYGMRDKLAATGIEFIRTEISLARTFLDRAATTRIKNIRERNRINAQAAHDAALLQLRRWSIGMGESVPMELKLALEDLQQHIDQSSNQSGKVGGGQTLHY
jgi:hypothetical protein